MSSKDCTKNTATWVALVGAVTEKQTKATQEITAATTALAAAATPYNVRRLQRATNKKAEADIELTILKNK